MSAKHVHIHLHRRQVTKDGWQEFTMQSGQWQAAQRLMERLKVEGKQVRLEEKPDPKMTSMVKWIVHWENVRDTAKDAFEGKTKADLMEAYNRAIGSGNNKLAAEIRAEQERRASGTTATFTRREVTPERSPSAGNSVRARLLRGR